MKIVINNSNNNKLLLKKGKKISRLSQTHCSRLGLNLRPSSFLPTYLPTHLPNYITRPNDLGYPTIRVFRYFLMHVLGGLIINYFRHYMFSHVIADAVVNTSLIL